MRGKQPLVVIGAFVLLTFGVAAGAGGFLLFGPRPSARLNVADEPETVANRPAQPMPETPTARPTTQPTVPVKREPVGTVKAPEPLLAIEKMLLRLRDKAVSILKMLGEQEFPDDDYTIGPQFDANVKVMHSRQVEMKSACSEILPALRMGDFAGLLADMERVERMNAVLIDNLGAYTREVSDVTYALEEALIGRLDVMLKAIDVELERVASIGPDGKPVVKVPAKEPLDGQPVNVARNAPLEIKGSRTVTNLNIERGASLKFTGGTLTVTGDFNNEGSFDAGGGTLVFGGTAQRLSGTASAKRIRMTGGEKHLVAGSRFSTTFGENAEMGDPALFIEAGATLVIDADAEWNTGNAYGVTVAGTLIVDGGVFNCSFSNGDGKSTNDSWLTGSQLIIRNGSFNGAGDADFSGASVYVQGGELRISDDIWNSGDVLELSGGVISNTSYGGMFALNGTVRFLGGRLEANQRGDRGLRVCITADVRGAQGEVVIGGQDVANKEAGINLQTSAMLPNLSVKCSTVLSVAKGVDAAVLTVNGDVQIDKGKILRAQGNPLVGHIAEGDEFGKFEP